MSQPYCQACLSITLNIFDFPQHLCQVFQVPYKFKIAVMVSSQNPTLNPKTCDPPQFFYCCSCKFGPMSLALHASCINCGHYGCSYCVAEAMESTSLRTASELESTAPLTGASSNADDSIIQPSPTASLTAFCRDNLSQANTIHETFSNHTPSDGEVYWYCCSCGDGPKTTTINPGCICGHWMCGGCRVTSGK